jgi:anti-sigma regulatory factor (Ser/Thr protein kinase)
MHIEAVTTQALAQCDLTLICAYPDEPGTSTAVRGAHPSLLNGAITPSRDHLPAEQFVSRHPLPPPADLGKPHLSETIDHLEQLYGLRRTVAEHASRAGLPSARCDDFMLAVSEVASNAIEHGDPPATVRLWATSTAVIYEITDAGRHTEPLAGLLPPPATQNRGRGLWLAYHLCDQFYLWPDPTTIRLQMDRVPAVGP